MSSSSKDQNKMFVLKVKELLKTRGHEVKTSHLYDIFAELAGYKNWHVASAKNADLTQVMKKYIEEIPRKNEDSYLKHICDFFLDDTGNKINFDLMDPRLPAWNYLITGRTGSGKSVFLNKILYTNIARNKNAIICILGGSKYDYFKLIEMNDGISINLKSLPKIQIFNLHEKEMVPAPQKIDSIAQYLQSNSIISKPLEDIKILVKDFYEEMNFNSHKSKDDVINSFNDFFEIDPNLSINKKELEEHLILKEGQVEPSKAKMEELMEIMKEMLFFENPDFVKVDKIKQVYHDVFQLIKQAYREIGELKGQFPTISDLCELSNNIRIKENLIKWTKTSEFQMFDTNQTEIDITKNIIHIDLNVLGYTPHLRNVYAILIQSMMRNKMYYTKNVRKIMVRDELSNMIEFEFLRKIFVEDLRASRMNGFSTITITQSPYDVLTIPSGKHILSNMNVNILGDTDYKEKERISDLFKFNDDLFEKWKYIRLKNNNGKKSSSFLILNQLNNPVVVNELNKFEEILYTWDRFVQEDIIHYYHTIEKIPLEQAIMKIYNKSYLQDEKLMDFFKSKGIPLDD